MNLGHLDIDGAPMPTSGAIAAGCHQTLAVQLASRVEFKAKMYVKGYGCEFASGQWLYPTRAVCPDGDAVVMRLKPSNELTYALYSKEILMKPSNKEIRHHPEADGWTDLVPLLSTGDVTAVYAEVTGNAKHYYVATDGNDAWDGLSPTNIPGTLTGPVRSPMVAVTNAAAYSTIFFAPGVYDYGSVSVTDSGGRTSRFRGGGKDGDCRCAGFLRRIRTRRKRGRRLLCCGERHFCQGPDGHGMRPAGLF